MPESAVDHVGHVIERLNESHKGGRSQQSRMELIEIIEAVLLALVALATAWSGYQAARWDGNRAELYSQADRLKVDAESLMTLAGQERIFDNETFDAWLRAKFDGKEKLAEFYERRFRNEYRPAFIAWLRTEPFKNAEAPPGPIFMSEYHNANREQSVALNKQAMAAFKQGTESGDRSDQYVRITVILATVLLITAIGQRFRITAVRSVFMVFACPLLCFPIARLFMLPRM
jgi:hypothetical protein